MLPFTELLSAAPITPPDHGQEIEERVGELVAACGLTILMALRARWRDFSGAAAVEAASCHMRDLVLLRASLRPDKLAAFEQIARRDGSAQLRAICADISDAQVSILIDGVLEILPKVIKAVAH